MCVATPLWSVVHSSCVHSCLLVLIQFLWKWTSTLITDAPFLQGYLEFASRCCGEQLSQPCPTQQGGAFLWEAASVCLAVKSLKDRQTCHRVTLLWGLETLIDDVSSITILLGVPKWWGDSMEMILVNESMKTQTREFLRDVGFKSKGENTVSEHSPNS